MTEQAHTELAETLLAIVEHDTDYPTRYRLVLQALLQARAAGMSAGIGYDPAGLWALRIVVYIELPTGQVSWHLPEHAVSWDGHSTPQKFLRIADYIASVAL